MAHFESAAKHMLESRDAVSVLAAALAVISGSEEIKARSLIDSREVGNVHFDTVCLKYSFNGCKGYNLYKF